MSIVQKKIVSGFSLIELVLVIVLIGILSVFVAGRLFQPNDFAARGFFDETVNAVRFAQKLAISSGCPVLVNITDAGYALWQRQTNCRAGSGTPFTIAVVNAGNRSNLYQNFNIPGGFAFTATPAPPPINITFNARGNLTTPGNITVTMTGGDPFQFTVYSETGLVQ